MQTASGATIRGDLHDVTSEYANDIEGQFMGLDILPPMEVKRKESSFKRLKLENITDPSSDGKRASGGAYDRQQSEVENDTYACLEYGFEGPIDDGDRANYENYFDAEVEETKVQRFRLRRAQEVRIAALVWSTATFSGFTAAVTTEWDNVAAVPYNDIQDAILTLKQQVGGALGSSEICMAFSEKVFRNVVQTTQIQAKIKGGAGSILDKSSGADMIGAARLADILGVNKVFYSPAQNEAADIWDDEYALLYLRNTGAARSEVQCGRSPLWTRMTPENSFVETYQEPGVSSIIVRAKQFVDEKIFFAGAGYLFSNITS
ncbi:MAG: hypothetical protein KAR42_14935 [candidate division Zixibacteria bacterium]|nr:hypothetical protein [candidate division Zixibacteria bacterium]